MYNDPNQPQPPYGQPQQPPYGTQPAQYMPSPSEQIPPQQYGQLPMGVAHSTPTPAPGYPGYMPPPQQKKSLRWLWITLGIVGGVLVLGCGACAILGTMGVNFFAQAIGPAVVVEQYYQAVEKQDYATAYTFVSPDAQFVIDGHNFPASSEQGYVTIAQTLDKTLGPVSTHKSQINGSDTGSYIVSVMRNGQVYMVHLTLTKIGNSWKISSADGI